MFRSKSIFLAAASGLAMMCHPALAQSVGPLNLPSPGTVLSPPPPAPELERRETPTLREELGLPDASEKVLDFKVSNVRIVGATVIDEQNLAAAFDDLLNQPITAGELRTALDRVNAIYAKEGYALGRAYIPAQIAKGGTLIVRIVEGYIGEIRIKADDEAVRRMVEDFSRRIVAENPLRQETLERYLLLISDIPGVTLDGRLQSMDIYSGAATLALDVTSEKFSASTAVDNRANLDSAPFQAYLTGFLNNIFGYGDQFSLTVLATPEIEQQQYVRAAFSSFIGTDGLRASGGFSYASSEQPDLPAGIKQAGGFSALLPAHSRDEGNAQHILRRLLHGCGKFAERLHLQQRCRACRAYGRELQRAHRAGRDGRHPYAPDEGLFHF
jgi:hemolysin activation/secretion protein